MLGHDVYFQSINQIYILLCCWWNYEYPQVRKQHLERTIAFLVEELKVVQGPQAEQRVFFVSAKEVLQQRLNESKGQPNNSKFL